MRFIYNDAYLPLLGNKHPALLRPGDQVWGEIWDTVGPMLDSVLRTGQATWSEDLLLPMDRHGYWEETYWTYSYSPLHDDDGTVRGVFTAVKETTEEVVGRRRLAVLQDLGAQAGQARSVAEACDLVVEALGRARQVVPFAAIYLSRAGRRDAALAQEPPGTGPAPLPGGPGGWPVEEVVRRGHPVTLTDVIARFGEMPGGRMADAARRGDGAAADGQAPATSRRARSCWRPAPAGPSTRPTSRSSAWWPSRPRRW